ncbi:MAG: exodeoxyribonuclease VII large subunit [Rhodoferax sp.]|nr:exodeoxyribonuclease VII large subunit [Rhodoferax sp.]MCF8208656.1 exodeoxyribonuclease VII large subunit [Rhodoferax sp.]
MPHTYLHVPFRDKDSAKAMGARWDALLRQWYVPEGRDLSPFKVWLPAATESDRVEVTQSPGLPLQGGRVAVTRGISLSGLLAGVSQAVAQAYTAGVWTLLEIVELRVSGGHVFLGVSERDSQGVVLARASAVIWQSVAAHILPGFEQATGAQLAPGIKLLVRARPVFKPQHGFSLEIDAVDSDYTLGELEARKQHIRDQLQQQGLFAANKQLPTPWDYNAVLVVAPEGGAGLGDFQAEANRLQQLGICQFIYVFSRFQGEGAAADIALVLQVALADWSAQRPGPPDALVILRGGGAVNDLAWLNDYALARLICESPVPVLTGIGHERDSTVLDEVAHTKYDTPSKVIAGIEQTIVRRCAEAKAHYALIQQGALESIAHAGAEISILDWTVRSEAQRHLALGQRGSADLFGRVRLDAIQQVHRDAEHSLECMQEVKTKALAQVAQARSSVPLVWGQISLEAAHQARSGAAQSEALLSGVLEHAHSDTRYALVVSHDAMQQFGSLARQSVRDAGERSAALLREVTGQGPDKTLRRGFALVHARNGAPVTRASQVAEGTELQIEFQDGHRVATVNPSA